MPSWERVEQPPPGQHRLEVVIEGDGRIDAHVTCHAPQGALCRLSCMRKGCEAEEWPCDLHDDPDVAEELRCKIEDSGECQAVLYLRDKGVLDCHEEGLVEPLRSGNVVVRWDGEWWQWANDDRPESI